MGSMDWKNPDVAKVEDAADGRRQGFGCSRLRLILDNTADAVSSAFPKGKQNEKHSQNHILSIEDIFNFRKHNKNDYYFKILPLFVHFVYVLLGKYLATKIREEN